MTSRRKTMSSSWVIHGIGAGVAILSPALLIATSFAPPWPDTIPLCVVTVVALLCGACGSLVANRWLPRISAPGLIAAIAIFTIAAASFAWMLAFRTQWSEMRGREIIGRQPSKHLDFLQDSERVPEDEIGDILPEWIYDHNELRLWGFSVLLTWCAMWFAFGGGVAALPFVSRKPPDSTASTGNENTSNDSSHLDQSQGRSVQYKATSKPATVFVCYAHEDKEYKDKLIKHLSNLKRQSLIETWHDREMTAGEDWKGEIDRHLEEADVILLLVSADFLASDYCYDVEMKRALERHETGEARVFPVLLRSVDWHGAPFAKLKALPAGAKAVREWRDEDTAFTEIARGVRAAVENRDITGSRDH